MKAEDYHIYMIFDTLYVTCPECISDVRADDFSSIQDYLDATKEVRHKINCESLTLNEGDNNGRTV